MKKPKFQTGCLCSYYEKRKESFPFFSPLVKVYSFEFSRHGLLWELKEGVDMGID